MILINLLIQISYCTIVGIDLGSDSIKVAVGSRNNKVHLVKNENLNNITPNVFTYIDKLHWAFGEEAIDKCFNHPEHCIYNQRVPLNNKTYFSDDSSIKGYQIVALSLLQIVQNVKKIEKIKDEIKIVVAIPPSMTNREKSYLNSALTIAGINCVQLVTSTYAPIELYVNEKRYESNLGNTAVFVDIGHEGVRVSGFEFDHTKITQKFGLYNDNFGGKTIDNNLLNLIINKYKLNISENNEYNKNKLKLLSKIKKARESLSFNIEFSFGFNSKTIILTRKDIDNCCSEIKESLNKMIQSLKKNNPNLLKSGSIHLLGGCSQIICLQEYIKKLLPNIKLLKNMDVIGSVCVGACYINGGEIQSNIQVHDALVATEVILKTDKNVYKIFSYENTKNFNPFIRINNVEPCQIFKIIDKNDNENEFTHFTLHNPNDNENIILNTIDIGFTLNCYLMPVPKQPMLIQQNGNHVTLSINYEKIGWEITHDELEKSKVFIKSLVNRELVIKNMNNNNENKMNIIEEYKVYVQNHLNNYGLLNWRRLTFSGIYLYINSLYISCLKKYDYECPYEQINSILNEFKNLVHISLNINNDEFETKFDEKMAIKELYDHIEKCKLSGIKYEDIEEWIQTKQNNATKKEIYENIGVLKERMKSQY